MTVILAPKLEAVKALVHEQERERIDSLVRANGFDDSRQNLLLPEAEDSGAAASGGGAWRSTGNFLLFGCEGFVQKRFEVGLVAQASLGSQFAGSGSIIGIEPDRRSRSVFRSPISSLPRRRSGPQLALACSILKSADKVVPVAVPSFGFLCFTCESWNFEIGRHVSGSRSRVSRRVVTTTRNRP